MSINEKSIIRNIVSEDYRTAAIFESLGIDYCCNGNTTIEKACIIKGYDHFEIITKIEKILAIESSPTMNYNKWPLDKLIDHIINIHHKYVSESSSIIQSLLSKIVRIHGNQYPYLSEIERLFDESVSNLAVHMKKEELILFPYIQKMVEAIDKNSSIKRPSFGSIINPIQQMKKDHETEGNKFKHIRTLSSKYTIPENACVTFSRTFSLLKEFDQNLHLHVHLENNILFPKSIALEKICRYKT